MKIETARTRVEMQGFLGLTDDEISQFNYWLRLAPVICLLWIGAGLAYSSPVIIGLLVPFAFLGGVRDGHPFDVIYNRGIRHVLSRRELPSYGLPRRFGCLLASIVLGLTSILLAVGANFAAYVLGVAMVVMASVQVTTGYCIPSALYRRLIAYPVRQSVEQR